LRRLVVKITGILPATPDSGEGVEKRELSILKAAAALAAAIFLSTLNAAPTAAAEAGFPGEPIVLHALSLERDLDTNIVVGEGAVDLTYGDLRLRADRVVIREREKTVIAEGNVILDEKESRLQGEYLELNLDTRTGFMTRGHGFAQDYFFTGERIEKQSDGQASENVREEDARPVSSLRHLSAGAGEGVGTAHSLRSLQRNRRLDRQQCLLLGPQGQFRRHAEPQLP
jgi:lipopolysaccharide export system protein LptA